MIKYLRGFCCIIFFLIFGICGFLIGNVIFPIIYIFYSKEKRQEKMANAVHYSWKLFMYIEKKLHFFCVNVHKIYKDEDLKGKVIIASHPCLLDIVFLIGTYKKSICFVKESLVGNFLIRKIIKTLYITNNEPPEKILEKSIDMLNKGFNLIIFPEGTRNASNTPKKIHRSFAQIAIKGNCKILPLKITQSFPMLNKGQKIYDIGDKMCVFTIEEKPLIDPNSFSGNDYVKAKNIKEEIKKILWDN